MTGLRIPDVVVAEWHKGFPPSVVNARVGQLIGRLSLADGDFLTPLLVLNRSAFDHNLAAMRRFCTDNELSLAPHVKTTMSPEIADAQLAHGAWAITLATPSQVMAMRALGAHRVLLANELVDPIAIDWLSTEMDRDVDFTCYSYVDSLDGLDAMERALGAQERARRLPVIVELGVRGGRAGVRQVDEAVGLAKRVAASPHLALAGVGGFEGVIAGDLDDEFLAANRAYLADLRSAADEIQREHGAGEFIVTVGGSGVFELVADELGPAWRAGRPIRVVLRSGCYVTHDTTGYAKYRRLMAGHYDAVELHASLELWARVLSRPEPGLAILDFGKRDAGVDAGYPTPRHRIRRDHTVVEDAPPGEVTALNDQHAYLRSTSDTPLEYEVGDLVGFGIAHPCTNLDKWRLIPVVDDAYRMVGSVQTLF